LFGKLREHDLEKNRLKEQENIDRKATRLALNYAALNEISEVGSNEDSETKTLNMLTRK